MNECIFCKIIMREIPAKIVHEDSDSVAFLDINPRSKGMCIVVPKKHYTDFDENFELSSTIFDKALIVAEKIKKSLNPVTVAFSIMQAQVPHFHIRVYPVYKDQMPLIENKPVELTEEELDSLAHRISSVIVTWEGRKTKEVEEKPKEIKEEKPKEKRSKEDIYWVKREMEMP